MTYYDSLAHFGTVSMVTASLGPNDPEVGARRRIGDEEYVFVYNTGGAEIKVGDCATFQSGSSGYSVTVSMVTGVGCICGVCKHATITTDTYGWLLTRGFTQINMAATQSVAVNGLLGNAANGKFAAKSVSTGYPCLTLGASQSAIASNGSGTAFIAVW